MTNDIKAIADGLSELLAKAQLPLRAVERADYAELIDDTLAPIAMTMQPDLFIAAVNAAPALLARITTLEADNASLREALATIAARNFNCSAHQHGMAAAGLAERTLLALSTQGTTDKGDAS